MVFPGYTKPKDMKKVRQDWKKEVHSMKEHYYNNGKRRDLKTISFKESATKNKEKGTKTIFTEANKKVGKMQRNAKQVISVSYS